MMRRATWTAAALVLACGGGGGGGSPTQPPGSIVFQPAGTAGPNSISLASASGSTAARLRLAVHATQVSGLYGIAFDLTYPSSVLTLASSAEGGFLGGASTSFQIAEPTAGRLVVGLSRLGAVAGVSGSGDLMFLEFTPQGATGSGSLAFSANSLFNSTAGQISGVSWIGGSVTVSP